MKLAVLLLPLLMGCTTPGERNRTDLGFVASGVEPDWFLSIRGGEIRVSIGHAERHQVSPLEVMTFPQVEPRREGDNLIWESQNGSETIIVESYGTPNCEAPQQSGGPSIVRVRIGNRSFVGCGGQQILVSG